MLEGLDPRHRPYFWIEEGRDDWESDELSDIFAVRQGLVSITPLQPDTTHHRVLGAFRGWEQDLASAALADDRCAWRGPALVL